MTNPFKKVKNAMQLMKSIDLKQLEALAQKVDLPKMLDKFSQLDERQMKALVKMLEQSDKKKELPVINGDFYETHLQLKPEHREIQLQVREFMEKEIKPLVNNYWLHDEFPDRKSTRLNSSHVAISYAVFCLNQKKQPQG